LNWIYKVLIHIVVYVASGSLTWLLGTKKVYCVSILTTQGFLNGEHWFAQCFWFQALSHSQLLDWAIHQMGGL